MSSSQSVWKRDASVKKTASFSYSRERRRGAVESIRKDKRRQNMQQRRKIQTHATTLELSNTALNKHIDDLAVPERRKVALQNLRELLSLKEGPPIRECHQRNLVSIIVATTLNAKSDTEMQLNAAWCLTNLATGTHEETEKVLEAAPHLIMLLGSDHREMQEQASWALGNLAGDCQEFRLKLLSMGVLTPLLKVISISTGTPNLCRTALWLLSNLVRGRDISGNQFIKENAHVALFSIARAALSTTPLSTEAIMLLKEVMWSFSFLSAKELDILEILVSEGVIQCTATVLQLCGSQLNAQCAELITPTIRTLGNVLAVHKAAWTEAAVGHPGVLQSLTLLLDSYDVERPLAREAAWVCSNLCAYGAGPSANTGSNEKVVAEISKLFLPRFCNLLCNTEFDIQREVIGGLFNLVSRRDSANLVQAFSGLEAKRVLDVILSMLKVADYDVVATGLDIIECILAKLSNPFCATKLSGRTGVQLVKDAGGIDALESVQFSSLPTEITTRAGQLVDKYYGTSYTGDSEDEIQQTGSTGFPAFTTTTQKPVGRGKHLLQPSWAQNQSVGLDPSSSKQKKLPDYGFLVDSMER